MGQVEIYGRGTNSPGTGSCELQTRSTHDVGLGIRRFYQLERAPKATTRFDKTLQLHVSSEGLKNGGT